jgi:tripartite-type tricarboxylate transporter receptor subunit TctC
MFFGKSLVRWIAGAALTTMTGLSSNAQTADETFFKGKTVRLVVGYGPGGGYDIYARLIAPAIARALSATIVIENQPGAGGLTALDRVYRAEPDGLTMMIVNGTPSALAQLVGQQGVRYDLSKMGHLGIVSAAPRVWTVGPNTPFKTPAEALKMGRPIMWSAGGPLDGLADGAAMACEALKMPCKVLLGYPGSNEATLAVTKGEADAIYQSDISAQNYTRSGQTRVMSILGRERSKLFPDVPTIFEQLPLDDDAKWWIDYRAKAETLGRILVAPPNLAPGRLATLRAAVKKGLSDAALIAEGARLQYPIDYGDAEDAGKAMLDVVSNLTLEQRARIKSVVLKDQ